MAIPNKSTLLDLVQAVSDYATNDDEIVVTVAYRQQRQGPALWQLRRGVDLSLLLNAIEDLAWYAQEDPRVKAALAHLARADSNLQVRDVASAMLGEGE